MPPRYPDEVTGDGFLAYAYRGTDPNHADNRMLRTAMHSGVTLLYLQGVSFDPVLYNASGAIIVADGPGSLIFHVWLVPLMSIVPGFTVDLMGVAQRRYYMDLVARRGHQAVFRSNVLHAYGKKCAVCQLGHAELLDAAHIISDRDGGEPVITNGLSLCKIHHAAFDTNILGVRPDLVAQIRTDVLEEIDGPMLVHGLQQVHGRPLVVPRRPNWRPDLVAVERRYEGFLHAS